MLRNVVALVGSFVHPFELGVVCEVFGLDRSEDGLPVYDFAVCTAEPGMVATHAGFSIEVTEGLDRVAAADLVTIPAWSSQDLPPPPEVVEALRAAVARGARILTVCSGVFLLAASGLVDGRRVTVHWRHAADLHEAFPALEIDCDALYVVDGPIVTSAGTASGIDACLHLVRTEQGAAVANAVARRMVVPPHRTGGQAQYIEAPVVGVDDRDALGGVLQWSMERLHEPIAVEDLAARALMSPRTFARRFKDSTGTTPHQWLLEQRLLRAESLLEETDLPIEQVAERVGFGAADTLRHHFARRRGVGPLAYRRTFRAGAAS
ncbi:helix-turn-helix domain-containing protein [Jatrophihabitans sp. YIM 134969]